MKSLICYIILPVIIVLSVSFAVVAYYNTNKNIPFEYVDCIELPSKKNCYYQKILQESNGFTQYIRSQENLFISMKNQGIDSTTILKVDTLLDYKKNDYILSYQYIIVDLHTNNAIPEAEGRYVNWCFDDKEPIIPTHAITKNNKLYVYSIEKNNKYRSLYYFYY